MPLVTPQSAEQVEAAFRDYGAAPGGKAMMRAEMRAAQEALTSKVYITWRSEVTGTDCSRVGSASRCFCGHTLAEHALVDSKNPRAPSCSCGCKRFEFVPSRPEEVGMWWLPRRKGFNVHAWRAPCKCQHGHDMHDPKTRRCRSCGCRSFESSYQCIGCEAKQEAHETVFELECERIQAKRDVGPKFLPLSDTPELQHALFASIEADAKKPNSEGARARAGGSAGAVTGTHGEADGGLSLGGLSLEDQLEQGAISVVEYQQRILTEPPPSAPQDRGGGRREFHTLVGRPRQPRQTPERPPPTVTAFQVPIAGGGSATVMTNSGPPIPRPGQDWSRPWEPGTPPSVPRRGSSSASGRGRGQG